MYLLTLGASTHDAQERHLQKLRTTHCLTRATSVLALTASHRPSSGRPRPAHTGPDGLVYRYLQSQVLLRRVKAHGAERLTR